jgi:hypothetical protein
VDPRDRFGSPLGPGRGDDLGFGASGGTDLSGPVVDNHDGTYDLGLLWDAGTRPEIIVNPGDSPPVSLRPDVSPDKDSGLRQRRGWSGCLVTLLVLTIITLVLVLAFLHGS